MFFVCLKSFGQFLLLFGQVGSCFICRSDNYLSSSVKFTWGFGHSKNWFGQFDEIFGHFQLNFGQLPEIFGHFLQNFGHFAHLLASCPTAPHLDRSATS